MSERDINGSGFGIEGLEDFERRLREAPGEFSEALWVGSRRALASFRRTFLEQAPPGVQGKGKTAPNRNSGARRPRTIGGSFRWDVYPTSRINLGPKADNIGGAIYSESYAAHGMEVGGQIQARSSPRFSIPIALPGKPNTGAKGGPKPGWRTLGIALEKQRKSYDIFPVSRGGGRVTIFAQRKRKKDGRYERPFPIFFLKPRVQLDGNLGFYGTWEGYDSEVSRRFLEELEKRIQKLARKRRR